MTLAGRPEQQILRLYDAAADPGLWSDVLHEIAGSVGAVGCCIAVENASETLIAPAVSRDLVDPIRDFMESGWYMKDLRGRRGWPLLHAGRKVLIEHDVSSEDERTLGDYHNEWLRPWDLPWWAAVGFRCGGVQFGLAILRNSRQGAFSRAEADDLAAWRPHLDRAIKLAHMLSVHRAKSILGLLERLRRPAFLLGTNGRVVEFNPPAEALVGRDLTLRKGRLRAADPGNDAALQRLVAAALAPSFPSRAREEDPVALRRLDRRPLVVEALPTVDLLQETFLRTRAILLVNDLDAVAAPGEARVLGVFDLTGAEAAVATRLATGADVRGIADDLGITYGTVRNHLKSVYAKTGTHRQGELIALVQRSL